VSDENKEFREKFCVEELSIKVQEHWTLSLRPNQVTLGSMVISSNAGQTSFSSLPTLAAEGLLEMFRDCERVAFGFGADKVNIMALMMVDPVVHFHVFPRYAKVVSFGGRKWEDAEWPAPLSLAATRIDSAELKQLCMSAVELLRP